MSNLPTIQTTIRTREGTTFDEPVLALTATNDTGMFDILPQHANFITLVFGDVKILLQNGTYKDFTLTKGLIRVKNNRVTLFMEA